MPGVTAVCQWATHPPGHPRFPGPTSRASAPDPRFRRSAMNGDETLSALDEYVAPGLRLWMLIALVSGVLLVMVVIVCCFMRIRIPRTKRQIDLIAARRKMRGKKKSTVNQSDEKSTAIVMNSMQRGHRASGSGSARKDKLARDEQEALQQHRGSRTHTTKCGDKMDPAKVTLLQADVRGFLARQRFRKELCEKIRTSLASFEKLGNTVEKKSLPNSEFLKIALPFIRYAEYPRDLFELSLTCRYMVHSLGSSNKNENLAAIFLQKERLQDGRRLVNGIYTEIPGILAKIEGEKVSEVKCWQALVHWAVVFNSTSSWALVKGNAAIQQILNSLCSKMAAPLHDPENYLKIAGSLYLAVNEARPLTSLETVNALFLLLFKPLQADPPPSDLMHIFALHVFTAPGLLLHLSKSSLELLTASKLLVQILGVFLKDHQALKSLDPVKALNLIGNLCHLGDLNNLLLVEHLLDWSRILNQLMEICRGAILQKNEKCSRTYWHPVFGGYKARLSPGSEASIPHVSRQLRFLWGRQLTNCLFGKLLPSIDPNSEQSKKIRGEASEIGHAIQRLWKKIGSIGVTEETVSLNRPLSMTTIVCQLFMNALSTFSQFRSEILSGICREDTLLVPLWTYLKSSENHASSSSESGPLPIFLSYYSTDPCTPHLAPLHLFCDASALTISILDEEEMYDKGIPFSQQMLCEIAQFSNLFCFRVVWNGLIDLKDPRAMALFHSVHNLNSHLHARDSRRSFTRDPNFWHASDVKSSVLTSEFDKKTERGLFLMEQMSHLTSLKERMVLFRRMVQTDKNTRHHAPNMITICRNRLVEDGYRQLAPMTPAALRHTIRVRFVNQQGLDEAGIDQDGVFKEFLEITLRQVFDPALSLFGTGSSGQLYPSATSSINEDHLSLFNYVGRLLAKAVYEGLVIDVQLAPALLASVLGSGPLSSFDELATLDPELYKNLTYVKRYKDTGDVSDLALTFSIDEDFLGSLTTIDLVPGGRAVAVTNENTLFYIHKMAQYRVSIQTKHQQKAFVDGFQSVLSREWLFLFSPHELQHLISGSSSDIDLGDLRKHVQYYGGFHSNHRLIKWLWQILESDFTAEERRLFLKFVTSCSRGPLLGFAYLEPPFSIRCVEVSDDQDQGDTLASVVRGFLAIKRKEAPGRLPTASTCFNLLKLPNYSKKSTLLQKLRYAIHSETGFELS
ncbi:unnamed protein product, partial [Mesorhabditis spiculigera]